MLSKQTNNLRHPKMMFSHNVIYSCLTYLITILKTVNWICKNLIMIYMENCNIDTKSKNLKRILFYLFLLWTQKLCIGSSHDTHLRAAGSWILGCSLHSAEFCFQTLDHFWRQSLQSCQQCLLWVKSKKTSHSLKFHQSKKEKQN